MLPVTFKNKLRMTSSGSGVPEVIGYLNGIRVSGCWNVQSFFAKVLSMIFTVPSGLIASVEGIRIF
jgi:chloride channel 7